MSFVYFYYIQYPKDKETHIGQSVWSSLTIAWQLNLSTNSYATVG